MLSLQVIVILYCNYHILVNRFFKLHNAFATIRRSLLLNCNCNITFILKVCNSVNWYLFSRKWTKFSMLLFQSFRICKKWNVLKFKEFWLTANFLSSCIVYRKGNRRSRCHKFTCTLRCFCIQIHIAIWNTVWYHNISFKKYTICLICDLPNLQFTNFNH